MAKITYVGVSTGGIYLPGDVYVEHGATVEVDDTLAEDLCARVENGEPQWVAATAPKTKPAPTTGKES
jgi:hypothetical protein